MNSATSVRYSARARMALSLVVAVIVVVGSTNSSLAATGDVTTIVGDPERSISPWGIALDANGNVYVAEAERHRIRKISPAGVAITLAGTGVAGFADGPGATAQFSTPTGIATDQSGNLYVADQSNHRLRKITPAGTVTTLAGTGAAGFADGPGATAQFSYLYGIATDSAGHIYVADSNNQRVRKVTPAGAVTTLAGTGVAGFADGSGATAQFSQPTSLAVDASGNVYVADRFNRRVRKITPAGTVTTLAGTGVAGSADGPGASAQFSGLYGVSVDGTGSVYVADVFENKIRKISPAGMVSTLAGSAAGFVDGPASTALFWGPGALAVDSVGNLFVSEFANRAVRKISLAGNVSTFFVTPLNQPAGFVVDGSRNFFIADQYRHRLIKLSPSGEFSTFSGIGNGFANGGPDAARFCFPAGTSIDSVGNVYVADSCNHAIRKITPAGVVSTLAGSGVSGSTDATGSAASFSTPVGVVVHSSGDVYVGDSGNNKVRRISPSGVVTTFAGPGASGPGGSATFNSPQGLAFDAAGNLYVAERNGNRISKITPNGLTSTVAGTGAAGFVNGPGVTAQFNNPNSVTVDGAGNLYVSDIRNHVIRKITPAGVVSTLTGTGVAGFANGVATAGQFNFPTGVFALGTDLYVLDFGNDAIRRVDISPGPDTAPPSISITSPAANQGLSGSPVTVAGSASDDVGVSSVIVAIYRSLNGGQYWNGTGWQATNTAVPATVTTPNATSTDWSYTFNAPPGGTYAVAAVAYDAATNYGIASYRLFSIVETTKPVVSLSTPTSGLAFSTKPVVISGTASDNAGIADVLVAVYRPVGTGQFWNGSAWQGAYVTVPAVLGVRGAGTTSFTYSFQPPQSGGYYYVAAVAIDVSSNYDYTPFTLFSLSDPTAPSAVITTPVSGASTSGTFSVSGTATDNNAIALVRIAIYQPSTNKFWNGTTWQVAFTTFADATLTAPGSASTTFSTSYTPPGPGVYYVGAVSYDANYNYMPTGWTVVNAT
jgi:sugar lactone lactonase YvrE